VVVAVTGRRWLMTGLAALAAAAAVAPAAVPIYDGIGNPDEPYRYVKAPASAQSSKAPTTASIAVPVHGSTSVAEYANTAENGPQLSLYLPLGAIQAPSGVTSVTVTATPTAPTSPLPTDGTIVTNVYRINADAGGRSLPVVGSGKREPTLQMRAPSGRQPGPVFEHRTSAGWQRESTIRVGVDVYQSQVPALGDWALVQLTSSSSSSGPGINWGFLGGGIALLVVAGLIVVVRVRRAAAVES
jgi:hypothetical protein